MKVAVVGTGYVGLVTGVVLASLGNDVVCVDTDSAKIEKLRGGDSPIFEPGIEELIQKGIKEGFLTFSTDTAEATRQSDVVFIAVGTPPGEDGTPDLKYVRAVATSIGKAIDKPTLVINKSTVPVGSGDLVENIILEQGVDPSLFNVLSNPEFLREGSAIQDTLHPDRIVIGTKNPAAAEKIKDLYAPLEAPVIVTDLQSAELIKYASNSFLALKISYINAISRICELCGANVDDVAKGMGADARIGKQFLQAGLGWGGSCFPKDVLGMLTTSQQFGYDFGLLQEVIDINDDQTKHFVRRLSEKIGGFAGKRIGVMGLAFKPNTDDIRDAKSAVVVQEILDGGGEVVGYDPIAMDVFRRQFPGITYVDNVYQVSEGADALILVTEWNEFRHLDLERLGASMKARILFDGRRVYTQEAAVKAGFERYTIGQKA
ncbi:UDP-glucose/GDP-mannose dehydrogenase family protein [bacterium]|nr:MAG: UDP-glucose/GDP-mannose dehydrogenase family protein [bacterium]